MLPITTHGVAPATSRDSRHSGLDVTVWQSDQKRVAGRLSHQGSSLLRWALFEAAQCAARRSSPDHAYYRQVAERLDHNRACLSIARKLCRRAHHILRQLGDDALAPIDPAYSPPRRQCLLPRSCRSRVRSRAGLRHAAVVNPKAARTVHRSAH